MVDSIFYLGKSYLERVYMFFAGPGGGVGFESIRLDLLLADLALSVDSMFDLIESATHVFISGFESFGNGGILFIFLDTIGNNILIGLRAVTFVRHGFPVRWIVRIPSGYCRELSFKGSFFFLEFGFEMFGVDTHKRILSGKLL